LRLLTSRDGDRPAVLLVDDMQWADPSSGDLVDHIARSIDAHRILLVIARRAEPVRAGAASNGFPRIALQRLDQQECERLAELVVQGRQISTELRHRILAQSDGVPLFIEELATAAVETGRLSSPQGSSAAELEPDVPFSLYDPLMIRLDRLGDAKRVAQLAAVIGRNFSPRILTAVAARRGEAAAPPLARLVEADIVRLDRDGPERVYSFKHSLVRDVAYSSLLRRDRRDLHALVAETIETEFPDVAEAEPAYLAQHLAEAGLIAEAARMWLKAAKQAAEKSANSEAIAQLQAALNQIRRLRPGREQNDLELDVQLALIGPTIAAKGYGAPDLASVSRRALDLCAALKDEVRIYPALYARWSYDRVTGDVLNACRLADEFLTLADRHGTRTGRMIGHRLLGTSLMLTGRFRSAREHLERCVALYDADLDQSAAVTYGVDARITALSLLSTVAWHLGDSAAGASYRNACSTCRARFGTSTVWVSPSATCACSIRSSGTSRWSKRWPSAACSRPPSAKFRFGSRSGDRSSVGAKSSPAGSRPASPR
jgi:hypothetical protein